MRRIVLGLLMMAALSAGCGTLHAYRALPTNPERREDAPSDPPPPGRFSRDAVPDSVMLRDQINAGYRDSQVPY